MQPSVKSPNSPTPLPGHAPVEVLRGKSERGDRPRIFLPGWGFDGRVLCLSPRPLPWSTPWPTLEEMPDPARVPKALAAWLDGHGVSCCEIVGWSLGGRSALEFARNYPQRASTLYLLAVRNFWPPEELEAIAGELSRQPRDFLRGFYRKCFLGYRNAYRRFQRELEEDYLDRAPERLPLLLRGLELLAAPLPGPSEISGTCRIHSLHGRRDVIAPVEERLRWPKIHCRVLEHGGHTLFLDDLPDFFETTSKHKAAIRRRFDRAAATYDANAQVQARTLELLLPHLPPESEVREILEIGCGTGSYSQRLLNHYPQARLTALDFSEKMLEQARQKLLDSPERVQKESQQKPNSYETVPGEDRQKPGQAAEATAPVLLCRDGEDFLAENRCHFDLVTANATLQWFSDLPRALLRIRAGLRPGGILLTTIFGGQTLTELAEGMSAVTKGRVQPAASGFYQLNELQAALNKVFTKVEVEEHSFTRTFGDLTLMLRHFRYTGTGGGSTGGMGAISGAGDDAGADIRGNPEDGVGGKGGGMALPPGQYRRLRQWFEERYHAFPATFQVFVVRAQ